MDKKDVVHIYSEILLSHWKEWNDIIYRNIDGPRESHTEWRKSDREGEILYDLPYMWNLKWTKMYTSTYKTERLIRVKEQTWFPRGKG